MTSFDDLLKKMHSIQELILTKISCADHERIKDRIEFRKNLHQTKCWFVRVSWKNKKRFLLDLIDEVQSISTISLLLKSIWNSLSKDAVLSISEYKTLSNYDQVPMDHDRTVPMSSIKDVIISNRKWFRSLGSDQQYLVLAELLSVAGGPIVWEVLKSAEKIFEHCLEQQAENLIESTVVNEPPPEKKPITVEASKKEPSPHKKTSVTQITDPTANTLIKVPRENGCSQLDTNLSLWASSIKTIKDNLKLEELEMTFKDGTKKRIWKVNRLKPETLDTVDFIQLLPSAISKRILLHLPLSQLSDCARVNKYWAYLVDEFRAELSARQKIDIEIEKLRETMIRHDESFSLLDKPKQTFTELGFKSVNDKIKGTNTYGYKSYAYSLVLEMNKAKQRRAAKPTFRNMTDLNTRLDIRGAADKNIRKWCANISKMNKQRKEPEPSSEA